MSCTCDLIGSVFTNSIQTCSNNIVSFSTTLSYATDDGSITASYIIALLMADLKNTLLVIDGQSIDVISDKSPSAMSSSNVGPTIGMFIGGFSIAAIISGVIMIVLM